MAVVPERSSRRGLDWRVVALGFALVLVAGLGFGAYIFFRYVHYDRVAALHVPPGAFAAARVDLQRVTTYEPIRRHVLPLANELGARQGSSRLERLTAETGIELGVDLRELVFALGPGAADFTLVLGGKLRRSGVLDGLAVLLRAEGHSVERVRSDILSLTGGPSIGHASDGALIVASSTPLLESALAPNSVHAALGLERESAGGFGVTSEPIRSLLDSPAARFTPLGAELRAVQSVAGVLHLESKSHVTADFSLAPGVDAAAFAGRLAVLRTMLVGPARLAGLDAPRLFERLDAASFEARNGSTVRMTVPIADDDLGALAKAFADLLRALAAR
jgi:hypothetical protein